MKDGKAGKQSGDNESSLSVVTLEIIAGLFSCDFV